MPGGAAYRVIYRLKLFTEGPLKFIPWGNLCVGYIGYNGSNNVGLHTKRATLVDSSCWVRFCNSTGETRVAPSSLRRLGFESPSSTSLSCSNESTSFWSRSFSCAIVSDFVRKVKWNSFGTLWSNKYYFKIIKINIYGVTVPIYRLKHKHWLLYLRLKQSACRQGGSNKRSL